MKSFRRWLSRSLALQLLGMVLIAGVLFGAAAQAGTVTFVYTDAQGTPVMEADAQGNITATYDYTPYGSQALGTPPEGPGYTGHVNDPDTGLVYMQARYYDPAVGRFLSLDPVGPSPGNTLNFGRYDYGTNSPIVNIDPDGRQSFHGYGSKLVITADCHQVNNCRSLAEVNKMTHEDAKAVVKFEGKVIVYAATVAIAIPRAILLSAKTATYIQTKGKEIGPPCIIAAASLGCNPLPVNSPNSVPRDSTANASWVEMIKRLEEARRLSWPNVKPKATLQPPPPPSPPHLPPARPTYPDPSSAR